MLLQALECHCLLSPSWQNLSSGITEGELRNHSQRGTKGGKSAAFGNSGTLDLCRWMSTLGRGKSGFSHQAWGIDQSSDCVTSEAQQDHTQPHIQNQGMQKHFQAQGPNPLAHPWQRQQPWMDPPSILLEISAQLHPELRNYPGDLQGEVKETPHPAVGTGKGISLLHL